VLTEIIKSTVNIPPTGVVNPGTVINIMVARDVSFSNVYALAK
jgi:type IV secretion system protein VirB10